MANSFFTAEFLSDLKVSDPDAFKPDIYVLHGKALKTDVVCCNSNCLIGSSLGKGKQANDVSQFWLFCYACDRTYHLHCSGHFIKSFTSMSFVSPWICSECNTNPNNESALKFYADGDKWKMKIANRRNTFLAVDDSKFDLNESFDGETPSQSTTKHSESQERFTDKGSENQLLLQMLKEQREAMDLLRKEIQEIRSSVANQSSAGQEELKKRQSVVFTDNVASSTRYDAASLSVNTDEALQQQYLQRSSDVNRAGPPNLERVTPMSPQAVQSANVAPMLQTERIHVPLVTPMLQGTSVSFNNVNENELSQLERIKLHKLQAQLATSEAQVKMNETMNLEIIRKNLPKMSKFDGDPRKWVKFMQDVKRYRTIGKYDDDVLKLHVLQALEGTALLRVQDIIDSAPLATTLKLLESSFGDPARIIDKCGNDILSLRISNPLYKDDLMIINTKIQAYFSACDYADVPYANSNQLAKHIFEQLNVNFKQMYRHQMRLEDSSGTKLMDLKSLFVFLEDLSKDLEDKKVDDKKPDEKKAKAIMVTNVNGNMNGNSSGTTKNEDYFYEIQDKNTHRNLGYDLNALRAFAKKCECCGMANHYTVQCRKYRNMDNAQKLKFVNDKNICMNCIITSSHRSTDCNLKNGCGYKGLNGRCSRKHHVSLHNAPWKSSKPQTSNKNNQQNGNRYARKGNSNYNQQRASHILQQSQQQPQQSNQSSGNNQPVNSTAIQSTVNPATNVIGQAPSIPQIPSNQMINVSHHNQAMNSQTNSCVNCAHAKINSHHNPYASFTVNTMAEDNSNTAAAITLTPYTRQANSITATIDIQRTVKVFKNKFLGKEGYVLGYSIGDSAAEVTLMRDDLRQALGLEGEKCQLMLQWTDNSVKSVEAIRVDLDILGVHKNAKKITLKNCYAVPDLNLPQRSLDMKKLKRQFPYLKNVKFDSYQNVSPFLLIGSPHASAIESSRELYEGEEGKPVGLLAKLGWCVYGGCPDEFKGLSYGVHTIQNEIYTQPSRSEPITNDELFDLLTFFSSIESLGIQNKTEHYTEDESKALEIIKEEMKVLEDGTIELPLIWNRQNKIIPKVTNNFAMVYKRQLAQELKLAKNPAHLQAYNSNFKDLICEGYVRAANNVDLYTNWENILYLPMSLVINANKVPIKYRNVFDASARYQGNSLNSNLLKGPDLLVDLLQPLLRMRGNKIAFTADIQAMFMRMKINLRDQQCQRVLWREHPEDEMKLFIVSSMLFGPTCSPFCSQYVKNITAQKWKDIYPLASKIIIEEMYMDDLLTSIDKLEDAISTAKQCIEIFKSINWKLTSFQSNNVEFLKSLPENYVKQELIPLLESENEHCTTKVLGCMWDTKNDSFIFNFDKNLFVKIVRDCQHKPTKRDQCSTLARIFDILGLIAHFTIRGKILLQRSWIAGIGWDDPISDEDHQLWLDWLSDIENIAKIKVKRLYNNFKSLFNCDKVELHTFCDAGGEAFAAVSYFITTIKEERYSNIVMAKAKVTPIRYRSKTQITEMPRLELCACLIASRIADTITKLYSELEIKRFMWTDSEVVLRWITQPNQKLMKYAISPIEEIIEKTPRSEWRYVPSKLNVADIATKFKKFNFADSNSMWYTGPNFLKLNEIYWPQMPALKELNQIEETLVCNVKVNNRPFVSTIKLPHIDCPIMCGYMIDTLRPSIRNSWPKLVRAVARGIKLFTDGIFPLIKSKKWKNKKSWIKHIEESNLNILTPNDLARAELFIIRNLQSKHYEKDYISLKNSQPINNVELKQLNVFMDNEGVIRINSRVQLSDHEEYPQRFAPLVPRKTATTRVLLLSYHYEFKHICIESQMAAVRSKFWIPQLRAALKSIQAHCNFCSFIRARPHIPQMAPLPSFRTNPHQMPFEVTGLDCLGPLTIRIANRPKKIWILIFVCTLTRFIHLHILLSLESTQVLEAIVHLWAAHGPVRTFISDRGTNFIGASRILREDKNQTVEFLKAQHKEQAEYLAQKYGVEWKMLPAYSPWMGAFYERLIKEVKRAIAITLDQKKLTKIELNIALHDAAHRINCRPLTHNSVSADDQPILTPHHLAKGRSGWPFLPGLPQTATPDIRNDRSVYRRGRLLADEIMRRFHKFYLPILTKRTKWFNEETPLEVGDLVLMIEPNDTRKDWKRARIIKLYKGSDKRSRVADVRLADGTIKKARATQRLAKIHIHDIEKAN